MLISNCLNDKNFFENYSKFNKILEKFWDLSKFHEKNKNFIKEAITYYINLVSIKTYKAYLISIDWKNHLTKDNDYNYFYSQININELVNTLFSLYEFQEFNFSNFLESNLSNLHHIRIRMRLKEIGLNRNMLVLMKKNI